MQTLMLERVTCDILALTLVKTVFLHMIPLPVDTEQICRFLSVDECASVTCLNYGDHVRLPAACQCACRAGFSGDYCGTGKLLNKRLFVDFYLDNLVYSHEGRITALGLQNTSV